VWQKDAFNNDGKRTRAAGGEKRKAGKQYEMMKEESLGKG